MSCENSNTQKTNKDEIINPSAECKKCMHVKVCSTYSAVIGTNEALMNTAYLKLRNNPIDIKKIAQQCTEFSPPIGKHFGEANPVAAEDLR